MLLSVCEQVRRVLAQRQMDPDTEILEERFAKGEIDKNEFEEKKRLLSD